MIGRQILGFMALILIQSALGLTPISQENSYNSFIEDEASESLNEEDGQNNKDLLLAGMMRRSFIFDENEIEYNLEELGITILQLEEHDELRGTGLLLYNQLLYPFELTFKGHQAMVTIMNHLDSVIVTSDQANNFGQ